MSERSMRAEGWTSISLLGALFKADGWDVRLEVGMPELGAHRNDASGDVDVLAWKGNVVCVCECKELLFARNISEVADRLVRFRGIPGTISTSISEELDSCNRTRRTSLGLRALEPLDWFHFSSPAKWHQCNSPRRLGRGYSPQTKSHTHYSLPSLDEPPCWRSSDK